jgi:hypothetical protein
MRAIAFVLRRVHGLGEQLIARNTIMTITRGIAAATMCTGLLIGTAGTAWADPTFSGRYTSTDTSSGGNVHTETWDVTPCGDACVKISIVGGGGAPWTAQLVNGQWQWDESDDMVCNDGTKVSNASTSHNALDASTLRGTSVVTYKKAGCGEDNVGKTFTHTLVLTAASSSSSSGR